MRFRIVFSLLYRRLNNWFECKYCSISLSLQTKGVEYKYFNLAFFSHFASIWQMKLYPEKEVVFFLLYVDILKIKYVRVRTICLSVRFFFLSWYLIKVYLEVKHILLCYFSSTFGLLYFDNFTHKFEYNERKEKHFTLDDLSYVTIRIDNAALLRMLRQFITVNES